MKVINELVDFIRGTRFEDLPPEAVSKAKEGVMDFLGCALLGSRNQTGKLVLDYVKNIGAKPEATVIGGGFRTAMALAALSNGTSSHADDYDDISFSLPGHPSVAVLPAVFCIGEVLRISGSELITAYLIGFEIMCKLGQALAPKLYQNGWHATSVYGCLGSAAAAGKLLDLSRSQMGNCLGIAASLSSGLRANLGTMTKPLHVGNCCQNGVFAAIMAEQGLTSSAEALDGPLGFCQNYSGQVHHDKIIGRLGNPYDIITPGIIFKRYPSCAESHPAIDATVYLAQRHEIVPDDVRSVECIVTPLNHDVLVYALPKTALEAKFSLHFCVAAGILRRNASLQEFTDEMVSNPMSMDLMKVVSMEPDPTLAEDGYTGAASIVTIHLKDGRKFSRRVDHAKGSPENPLSMEELLNKYRDCAGKVLGPAALDRSIDCLLKLEELDQISQLTTIINDL